MRYFKSRVSPPRCVNKMCLNIFYTYIYIVDRMGSLSLPLLGRAELTSVMYLFDWCYSDPTNSAQAIGVV